MSRQLLLSLLAAAVIVLVVVAGVLLRVGPDGLTTPDQREDRQEQLLELEEERLEQLEDR